RAPADDAVGEHANRVDGLRVDHTVVGVAHRVLDSADPEQIGLEAGGRLPDPAGGVGAGHHARHRAGRIDGLEGCAVADPDGGPVQRGVIGGDADSQVGDVVGDVLGALPGRRRIDDQDRSRVLGRDAGHTPAALPNVLVLAVGAREDHHVVDVDLAAGGLPGGDVVSLGVGNRAVEALLRAVLEVAPVGPETAQIVAMNVAGTGRPEVRIVETGAAGGGHVRVVIGVVTSELRQQ